MNNFVEKLWRRLGESVWNDCGKVEWKSPTSSLLVIFAWKSGDFAQFLNKIYTAICTGFLARFNLIMRGFYTVST